MTVEVTISGDTSDYYDYYVHVNNGSNLFQKINEIAGLTLFDIKSLNQAIK